jgi:hypothetical protein
LFLVLKLPSLLLLLFLLLFEVHAVAGVPTIADIPAVAEKSLASPLLLTPLLLLYKRTLMLPLEVPSHVTPRNC